jgi:hypothetical protein
LVVMQPQFTRVEGASIVMESFELTSPVIRLATRRRRSWGLSGLDRMVRR